MFSVRARDAMFRRRGIAALGAFARESWRDAGEARRAHRSVMRAAIRTTLAMTGAVAACATACVFLRDGSHGALTMAGATLLGGLLTALLVACSARLFVRAGAGPAPDRALAALATLGIANALTLFRFVLIAPVVVLLVRHHPRAALGVYALLVVTDVADGVLARVRREESEFGVVMDPLADVASTYAVYSVFLVDNVIPGWLYLLLTVRYAMLLVGSLALFLAVGEIEFRATVPGKVVGVVQAIGAAALMVDAGDGALSATGRRVLFAFLGLGFASIVLSQAVLGWEHIRRAATRDMR